MSVTHEKVSADYHGQRIDNYLITRLKGVPKSRIYRAIRGGEVRVNKGRVSNDYRLVTGDDIRVPPLRQSAEKATITPSNSLTELLNSRILFENDNYLILNKPSGLPVHGGSETKIGLIEALRATRPQQKFLELAHRLDKGTSGCLILAKKRTALLAFQALLKIPGNVQKRYLTLVKGHWPKDLREVNRPLLKEHNEKGAHFVKVDSEQGKKAKTGFKVVQHLKQASLLEVTLHTGRTHQVRVHTAISGHPIAGDDKYGDFTFNKALQKQGLNRLFLHAASVTFKLPEGEAISVEAPLDADLKKFLEKL